MTETQQLLKDYACGGSEAAFRELVQRYVDLVYSTALRWVAGDHHLAEDVAQTVFADLARSARSLPAAVLLGGWLHRHTCFVASKTLRTERRRQQRERQAAEMCKADEQSNTAPLGRVLDEAINELNEADRLAILLRFYEQLEFRAVGQALGGTEDAARMRVNRALEKLHSLLSQKGAGLSAAAVAGLLASGAVSAAPAGLAASISTGALAGATLTAGIFGALLTSMTKLQIGCVTALAVAVVAVPVAVQQRSLNRSRDENRVLQQQLQKLETLEAENRRLSGLLAQAGTNGELSKSQLSELLKLRSQVGMLRRELAGALPQTRTNGTAATPTRYPSDEEIKQVGIAKLNYAKHWILAFYLFSEENGGVFPTNFAQALPFLGEAAKTEHDLSPDESGQPRFGLTPENYEILYRGSMSSITNPQNVIVIREKEAWPHNGGWHRAYAFADGHSEIHRADDGNFEAWEAERIIKPAE